MKMLIFNEMMMRSALY